MLSNMFLTTVKSQDNVISFMGCLFHNFVSFIITYLWFLTVSSSLLCTFLLVICITLTHIIKKGSFSITKNHLISVFYLLESTIKKLLDCKSWSILKTMKSNKFCTLIKFNLTLKNFNKNQSLLRKETYFWEKNKPKR